MSSDPSPPTQAQPVAVLNRTQLDARLLHLRTCLNALPQALPSDTYDFRGFDVSDEDAEDLGRAGALNRQLERIFCPQGRIHGLFTLQGRGEGLLALVDVLSSFTEEFPSDVVLQKWVEDLIQAAELTTASVSQCQPRLKVESTYDIYYKDPTVRKTISRKCRSCRKAPAEEEEEELVEGPGLGSRRRAARGLCSPTSTRPHQRSQRRVLAAGRHCLSSTS